MSNWRQVLEELDIAATDAAGPAGAAGDWSQLVAAFGARAFLRALTDGAQLVLECAPPGDPTVARGTLAAAGWALEAEDTVPFVAKRAFPDDAETMRPQWVQIARLADATRAEDAAAFAEALATPAAPTVEPDEPVTEPAPPAVGAFEAIGNEAPRPEQTAPFAFALAVQDGAVAALLGFGEVLERHEYDALERRLVGNLRGKFDVEVEIAPAHEVPASLDAEPRSRIALRVRPDRNTRDMTLARTEESVGAYFETLLELATSGIDPLVFLGVRASKRSTGAFESIGGKAAVTATLVEESGALLVDDDEPEPDDEEAAEVVFGAGAPLDPNAPLEPRRYDDERLRRSDATTALVDVVLRHPGYSDRSIGQVLSILLSLDYASCLEIAERAPTVMAWGVARDRALTMKTVVEGAGGKVLLVEPGTFGTD